MSNTYRDVEQDVAWLKSLAEAGQAAPLQTGPYLVAGGVWFGGASFLLALAQLGVVGMSNNMVNWVWIAAAAGSPRAATTA